MNAYGGGFFDVPKEVYSDLTAAFGERKKDKFFVGQRGHEKVTQFKIETVQCYTQDMRLGKKYVIQMKTEGLVEFKAEFHPNEQDKNTIDFSRDWGFYKATTSFPNANVEEFVSKWFVNLLSEQKLYFNKIVMEILPEAPDIGFRDWEVQTLNITIPNKPYEDGLLEWWLGKFKQNIELVIITSMTQTVNIPDNPNFFRATNLELKGLFDIQMALFPRITAKKITFEDLSGTSIVNSDVVRLILNDWLAVLGTPRDIKFKGNYGEPDIEENVVKYLEKKANLQTTDDVTREYLFESGSLNESATIIFYKKDTTLHLRIIPINPPKKSTK